MIQIIYLYNIALIERRELTYLDVFVLYPKISQLSLDMDQML